MRTLLLFSLIVLSGSTQARCFEFIFGGGELNAADGQRMIARGEYVKKYAKRLGCKTLFFKDKSKTEMESELRSFITDNQFNSSKDRLHISIIAHGNSRGVKINSAGIITYENFLDNVDRVLPAGSRVTFTGQSCQPRFNASLHERGFQNIESICGVTASSGSKKAILQATVAESGRLSEFVPTGMKFWAENQSLASLSNFYYQGAASSIYHLARGARSTSMWYAKTELRDMGFEKVQRIPLLHFIDGSHPMAKREMTFDLPRQPIQLLSIMNNQVKKPSYSSYLNMYELFYDIAQINAPRLLNEIASKYGKGVLIKQSYYDILRYLSDSTNWDIITRNIRFLHHQRITKGEGIYPKCDFIKSFTSCSSETRKAASRMKNYIAGLKQLDDIYIALMLYKKSPSKFEKFMEYYNCENQIVL